MHPDHTHFPVLPGALHCCDLPPKKRRKTQVQKSNVCCPYKLDIFNVLLFFQTDTFWFYEKKERKRKWLLSRDILENQWPSRLSLKMTPYFFILI